MAKLTEGMFSSNSYEWETPQDLFDELDAKYHFTLDPCATPENTKCEKFYTIEDDGLSKDWNGERVFMNSPYGRVVKDWVKKASEIKDGLVACLLPARTDTRYFHDYIYDKETGLWKAEVHLLKGRLKFGHRQLISEEVTVPVMGDTEAKQKYEPSTSPAPFPSTIVVFDPKNWDDYCLQMMQKWALAMRRNYD